MKIYVKSTTLAETIAHQNRIPQYILNNDSVNKILAILKDCQESVPEVQSKLELFYRRPSQPSVDGENVTIRLIPQSIPGSGWSDPDWVAEFARQSDLLYKAFRKDIRKIKSLPEVVYVNDENHINHGPYINLKITNVR